MGISLKFFKVTTGSPAFRLIMFSWLVALLAALFISPLLTPPPMELSFLSSQEIVQEKPLAAYHVFYSLIKAKTDMLSGQTDLEKIRSRFVVSSLKAKSIEENLTTKNYGFMGNYLNDIEQTDPFFAHRAHELRLLSLYHGGKYEEFVRAVVPSTPQNNLFIVPLVHAHLQLNQTEAAQGLLNKYFSIIPINTWTATLPTPSLTRLISNLPLPIWQAQLDILQKKEQYTQLTAILRFRPAPERTTLIQALALYQQKEYYQAGKLLDSIKTPSLQLWKDALRLKLDAKSGRTDDLLVRVKQLRHFKPVYLTLLSDLGGILNAAGNDRLGLTFYTLFISEIEALAQALPTSPLENALTFSTLAEQEPLFWQIVLRNAWLNYKMDKRDEYRRLLDKCLGSSSTTIRQSALAWISPSSENITEKLDPYSYDFARLQGKVTIAYLNPFLKKVSGPLALSETEQTQLLELVQFGQFDEAISYCQWLIDRPKSDTITRNVLAIAQAIIYGKQKNHPQAFNTFKLRFPEYSQFVLPRFLSFLTLPLDHQDLIKAESKKNKLDPTLITSLIRQESFFSPNATSPANAYGLMQLLLRTAQENNPLPTRLSPPDLFVPRTNIALGCRFFKSLMNRYGNRIYLALAAYNAGPDRVDSWLSQLGNIPQNEFIELIPFAETRQYVKTILRNNYFYRYYNSDIFTN